MIAQHVALALARAPFLTADPVPSQVLTKRWTACRSTKASARYGYPGVGTSRHRAHRVRCLAAALLRAAPPPNNHVHGCAVDDLHRTRAPPSISSLLFLPRFHFADVQHRARKQPPQSQVRHCSGDCEIPSQRWRHGLDIRARCASSKGSRRRARLRSPLLAAHAARAANSDPGTRDQRESPPALGCWLALARGLPSPTA